MSRPVRRPVFVLMRWLPRNARSKPARCSMVRAGTPVVGRLMPAATSLRIGALPLGLAHGVKLRSAVAAGEPVRWTDVQVDARNAAVKLRREMEGVFALAGETVGPIASGLR